MTERIGGLLVPDAFGKSTTSNVYLDSPDFLIVRNSIDARKYKEKLRIRSYGTPTDESPVFIELKKKFDGVVFKRRISTSYKQARDYIYNGVKIDDSQIMREIDWFMNFYKRPMPAAFLAYEREAFYWEGDDSVRLTFDRNIRYRTERVTLGEGSDGIEIIPRDMAVMEIKTPGAMPLLLSSALDECGIFPASFSKYGRAYSHMRTVGRSPVSKPQIYADKSDGAEWRNTAPAQRRVGDFL